MIHFRLALIACFLLSACQDIPYGTYSKAAKAIAAEEESVKTAAQKDLMLALVASGGEIDHALFWLVTQNKHQAIKLAKERGGNVNAVNAEGDRPLCVATQENKEEVVKALIKEGAEINYVSNAGRSPLGRAAYNGFENIIKILIQSGADANYHPDTLAPLHMAARFDQVGSIHALVSLSANVNLFALGETAAHEAARWCRPRSLKALLENGANPHLKDSDGKTVFDLAEPGKHSSGECYELGNILSSHK